MSPPGGSDGCLHPGRASAHDQDLLFPLRFRLRTFRRKLLAHGGIHHTFYHLQLHGGAEALVAAQTGCDVIRAALVCFFRQIRIGQHGPSDLHRVGLPGGNDLLHLGRVVQGAHTGNRGLHMLFDGRRQIHVDPSRIKCGRMGSAEHIRILMVSAGYVDQIYFAVDHLRHLDAVLHPQADVRQVIPGDPRLNRELGAHRVSDRLHRQQEKSGPVFQTSSKFIRPLVHHRG